MYDQEIGICRHLKMIITIHLKYLHHISRPVLVTIDNKPCQLQLCDTAGQFFTYPIPLFLCAKNLKII
ncbi:hypothetical protein BLA29_004700 [Euroglyphus maynei]|uniref:Uncharacterized protein n=1 Tax=Euroglyphus maynei TaxID=6958 RepID=A0A1Y3B2B7_EURMA|nr:hypothetical protein BLA29_004700 [Euroglyphus maynei]